MRGSDEDKRSVTAPVSTRRARSARSATREPAPTTRRAKSFTDWLSTLFGRAPETLPEPTITREDARALAEVEGIIGHKFKDRRLLAIAFLHRSAGEPESYERLEFLGDAVLGVVVAHRIFAAHPEADEGQLTKGKSSLVNERRLAEMSTQLGFNKYLKLSTGEERSGGRTRRSIIADLYESVIGAMFIDAGLKVAERFIDRTLLAITEVQADLDERENAKGILLEFTQGHGLGQPRYSTVSEVGPSHQKMFTVAVTIDSVLRGEGLANTKKEAERLAAKQALFAVQTGIVALPARARRSRRGDPLPSGPPAPLAHTTSPSDPRPATAPHAVPPAPRTRRHDAHATKLLDELSPFESAPPAPKRLLKSNHPEHVIPVQPPTRSKV